MKTCYFYILSTLIFLISPVLMADSTEFNLCRLKEAVRSVRVVQTDAGKCLTVYARGGKDQIMAESSNLLDCTNARDNILNNLKQGQFECQLVSDVRFTFIAPSAEPADSTEQDVKE
jgi:hypothetical protein